jgi:mono/diheme cytochrome c family protein
MKVPPENTVPQGFEPYTYQTAEEAGAKLKSPLTMSDIDIQEGQKYFMTYCFVCHGAKGDGHGPVAEKWPSPIPNMLTKRVREYPDGHIYHIITKGRGLMGSYAAQVKPNMRWKIITYIRHLQSKSPVLPDTGTTAQ